MPAKKKSTEIITEESIQSRILFIRGKKVMLDRDLARLYGVTTKVFNQAVKRNIERFPEDFMFRITKEEKQEVVTICDHLEIIKYSPQLPYAFTEQGVTMLSCVLSSPRAIHVNIQIIRAFTRLREMLAGHKELKAKVKEMEKKYDHQFQVVFEAIKRLIDPPEKPKRPIGFHASTKKKEILC